MRTNIVGQESSRFVLENEHGETFDSSTLDGSWRIVFFYSQQFSNLQAWLSHVQGTTRLVLVRWVFYRGHRPGGA